MGRMQPLMLATSYSARRRLPTSSFNSAFSTAKIVVPLLLLLLLHLEQYFKDLFFCFVLECLSTTSVLSVRAGLLVCGRGGQQGSTGLLNSPATAVGVIDLSYTFTWPCTPCYC